MAYTIHWTSSIWPKLDDDTFAQLCASVAERGLQVPILLWRGEIVDGAHRQRACDEVGAEAHYEALPDDWTERQVWEHVNIMHTRRELSAGAHAAVAFLGEQRLQKIEGDAAYKRGPGRERTEQGTWKPLAPIGASGGHTCPTCPGETFTEPDLVHCPSCAHHYPRADGECGNCHRPFAGKAAAAVAACMGVSTRAVERAKRVSVAEERGVVTPGLLRAVADQKMALDTAERIVKLPDAIRADVQTRVLEGAKFSDVLKDVRRAERTARIVEQSAGNKELASPERYSVILADPPWRYEHVKTESRAIENQYPTMDLEEICALPVADVCTDDAVLFMWATSPKLEESLRVVNAWGFTYRTCMVWVKDKIGMGYYARQRHELLLICTRGAPPVPLAPARPDSVIEAPRGRHSAKPVEAYEAIERMYPELSKLEMFCRSPRDGWTAWGNEAS